MTLRRKCLGCRYLIAGRACYCHRCRERGVGRKPCEGEGCAKTVTATSNSRYCWTCKAARACRPQEEKVTFCVHCDETCRPSADGACALCRFKLKNGRPVRRKVIKVRRHLAARVAYYAWRASQGLPLFDEVIHDRPSTARRKSIANSVTQTG